ncbi:MAG: helix-turn-helix domain-containing protein [Thermoplasmatales archaeon]|nr:helix-turn-helix domain-containing protein [Thermoplasmatales archaeon]
MTRRRTREVARIVTENELSGMISRERSRARIVPMLIFIRMLYKGKSVPEATSELGISKRSGYLWLNRWNKKGIDGLVPMHGGGFRQKLTSEQMEQLKGDVSKGSWTTDDVRKHIKLRFNVDYSMRQVSRILKKFKMHYAKPYPHDYRRPKDAEDQLKKTDS